MRMYVCVRERERARVCVCASVCVRERETGGRRGGCECCKFKCEIESECEDKKEPAYLCALGQSKCV